MRYMDVKSRNGEKFEIFSNFGPSFGTPLPKWMALSQNVRRSVPYICDCSQPHLATLRKTETADG